MHRLIINAKVDLSDPKRADEITDYLRSVMRPIDRGFAHKFVEEGKPGRPKKTTTKKKEKK